MSLATIAAPKLIEITFSWGFSFITLILAKLHDNDDEYGNKNDDSRFCGHSAYIVMGADSSRRKEPKICGKNTQKILLK